MAGWDIEVDGAAALADGIDEVAAGLEDATWVVGTNVEYAIFLEKGTSEMPPYPFMKPAIDTVMARHADQFADEADSPAELIRKIAFKIEEYCKYYTSDNVPPGPDEVTSTLTNSFTAKPV